MSNPFIGQVQIFAGTFAPRGWALCDGQLLPIAQNTALFSILGTTYGGDGRTTFGLPDLRGRDAMGSGRGPGLSDRRLGASTGSESNVLNVTQIPPHSHAVNIQVNSAGANQADPTGHFLANAESYNSAGESGKSLGGVSRTGNSGQNQSIGNMQPSLVINFIIALQGTYPSRS